MTKRHSFHIQASRLYDISSFFYEVAANCDLYINIQKSGIFMVDYFVSLEGEEEDIKYFLKYVGRTFDRINAMD